MSTSYREKVIADYKKKKAENQLSINLLHPTAAGIRNECIAVFETRYQKKDESIVRYLVGEKSSAPAYLIALKIMEADKVKSLAMYLQGRTDDTGDKNIELLAWLINYEPRPHAYNFEVSSSKAPPQKTFSAGPFAVIKEHQKSRYLFLFVPLIAIGAIMYWSSVNNSAGTRDQNSDKEDLSKDCMFWTGDRYQKTPCDTKKGDTLIVGLNSDRLQHFHRLTVTDTITSNAIGKLWYSKINSNVEFFTAGGFHPVHVERRLHPVTQYMIDKYAHN